MDRELLCQSHDTIRIALKKINANCKGVVFIVGENDVLKGMITEGDIRRGLLADMSLDNEVSEIANTNYIYAYSDDNISEVVAKFNYTIKIIPIVNKEKQIVDFFEYRKDLRLPITQPWFSGKELENLLDAFMSTWISSTGKYVTMFEDNFSKYCGVDYGIATSSGTTALHLALVALGIKAGDEVIVPDITFAATINAVLYTGATPVIVDVEQDSWCIDPQEIEKAITKKTRAIIPVHIYGQVCNMNKIMAIAEKCKLYVIEDCAEAHGAEYLGKKVGSFGNIGCFSFFGNKVITTGEGGMCITNDKKLCDAMRLYRDHGMNKNMKYFHDVVGFNYRMTNLQASIGVAQLENIENTLMWRDELEKKYRNKLKKLKYIHFQKNDLCDRKKIVWLVTIYVDSEELKEKCFKTLQDHNIDVRPFFIPLSEMPIYKEYVFSNKVSKDISKRGFNLPTAYTVGNEEVDRVFEALANVN